MTLRISHVTISIRADGRVNVYHVGIEVGGASQVDMPEPQDAAQLPAYEAALVAAGYTLMDDDGDLKWYSRVTDDTKLGEGTPQP